MKKHILFILPALIIGLAACNNTTDLDEEAVQKTANLPTLFLDYDGGLGVLDKTYNIKYGDAFLGLEHYTYGAKTVDIEWTANSEKVKISSLSSGLYANRSKITFAMGKTEADDYNTVVTGTIKCGAVTQVVTFNANVGHTNIIDTTIKEFKEGYKDAGYNTSLTGDAVKFATTDTVSFYGYVTGTFEPSNSHLYSGVWIQDGADSIQLYANKLGTVWFVNELAIGDLVHVVGYGSGYNGLLEVKPSIVDKMQPGEVASISAPTTITFNNADGWTATELLHKDSNLVQFNNLVYKSGTAGTVGAHWTLTFEGTKSDGTTKVNVTVYVNYHIGATAQQAIKDMMATWTAGVTTIDLAGVISWYNGPQIVPVFMDGKTPDQGIVVHQAA